MAINTFPRKTGVHVGLGNNTITVGNGGDYESLTDAVTFINSTTRYTVVYETGTATLTNGTRNVVPSGGADFTGLSTAADATELWLYLDTALVWMPLIGMAPRLSASWGDYGELKYNYEGSTGAKSYQLVTPNWYHILILPGETVDTTVVDWPLFTTMSGVDRESCVVRGAIHVDASSPGIWTRNLTWGSIYGTVQLVEEAFITVDDTIQSSEEGYAEIVIDNFSGGRGNADRDVFYRTSSMISHGLFQCTNSDLYAHYDTVQCTARNLIFKHVNTYIRTQDTTVMNPTGFRWFSGSAAPETILNIDMTNNNFYVEASGGARITKGLVLLDDQVAYLTAPPDVYGRITDNFIQVYQLGTGDATGIENAPALFSANAGKVLIDNNTFDVVSSGGTRIDIYTHTTASPLLLGRSNYTVDGSAFNITGVPFRMQNQGTSAAIASGGTIAHGLRYTPTEITVTPADTGVTDFYATADGTNITVTYSGGGTHAFNWKAGI